MRKRERKREEREGCDETDRCNDSGWKRAREAKAKAVAATVSGGRGKEREFDRRTRLERAEARLGDR